MTKLWLLETFMREERIGWDDPWLASLDLEYHNVDTARGLFLGLEQEGKVARVVMEADIHAAMMAGPCDTRGGIRGLCVRRFPDQIFSMQWERVRFGGRLSDCTLELGDLFEPASVATLSDIIEQAASPADVLARWSGAKETHS